MAGILLPAPTLGDSNWSTWITLVDACRRGYLAASYTNFAASAESALAAGSLVEVAGAIYSFTETAINYTGAGSTDSDLYIYVVPSAAVSTATVVAWGSAPVWVSAKQGFYASAASTTRAIGGMYVEDAGSYSKKYFYEGELFSSFLKKIIPIGDWNMDTTANITINHGITDWKRISKIDVLIRNDTDALRHSLSCWSGAAAAIAGGISGWGSSGIGLYRLTAGTFDGATYDSTSFNRGWVYIEYET